MDPFEHKVSPLFLYSSFLIILLAHLHQHFLPCKLISFNNLMISIYACRTHVSHTRLSIADHDLFNGWWFESCPSCNKSLSGTGNNLKCIEHSSPSSTPIPWWIQNTNHYFFSTNTNSIFLGLFSNLIYVAHFQKTAPFWISWGTRLIVSWQMENMSNFLLSGKPAENFFKASSHHCLW